MRMTTFLIALAAVSAGCSSSGIRSPFPRRDEVVVVNDKSAAKPRELHVPKGHYPPPGQCRVWYPGTPPGHQPAPTRCSSLVGKVPAGAFVLYNARAYDTNHDWAREKKQRPGEVPDVIVELTKEKSNGNSKPSASKGKKG
jgi:hypothetical protein